MNKFILEIQKFINEYRMLENADGVVIGLSGGPDSVCLLCVICELADSYGILRNRIYAVHINHMLRGADADGDEEFSAELCSKLGVSFVSFKKDIKAYAKECGCTVEEAGRAYRYECFRNTAKANGLNKIAVAHNKNDVAETVLFNIIRGTGIKGLSGMSPVRDDIIRPLLMTDRAEIEKYLESVGQDYRTDKTNLSTDYDRNKIRHIILPEMTKINGGALEHICQMAGEAAKAYDFIHKTASEDMKKVVLEEKDLLYGDCDNKSDCRRVCLDVNKLKQCDEIIMENIIHAAIAHAAGKRKDINRKHILSVVSLLYADTGNRVILPYNVTARRSYDRIIIDNNRGDDIEYNIEITEDGNYVIEGVGTFSVKKEAWQQGTEVSKKTYTKLVDYGKIRGNVCIRTPKTGDYIIIDGNGNSKKLSRVFIDQKVDRNKRKTWPVVACGNEILWAVGLRYSEAYKVDNNTDKVMYIKFKRKGA